MPAMLVVISILLLLVDEKETHTMHEELISSYDSTYHYSGIKFLVVLYMNMDHEDHTLKWKNSKRLRPPSENISNQASKPPKNTTGIVITTTSII